MAFGQELLHGYHSYYDDTYRDWVVLFDEEGEGTIELKWPLKNDWTQWRVSIGDYNGFVKQRWSNAPGQWEAKINGYIIDIKTIFPRDYTSWRLKMDDTVIDLKMVHNNSVENWTMESKEEYLDIFTARLGDPRDWIIDDQLEEIPIEMKIAAMVLCIYQSCPKI